MDDEQTTIGTGTTDPVEAEIERIASLPPAERAGALEALEARLRATLDDVIPG